MSQANYHPYEFVRVHEKTGVVGRSYLVVKDDVADDFRAFFQSIEGLVVRGPTASDPGSQRFDVEAEVGTVKYHLRRWAAAWRKQREEIYPPVDVVHVRGKETADVDDILHKTVIAHLRNDQLVTGEVIAIKSDWDWSGRLCLAHIMVNSQDRSLDRYLQFDEVLEFELLD